MPHADLPKRPDPRAGRLERLAGEVLHRPRLVACLLGLLALLVFLPAVACGFVNWDDNAYVYANPVVLRGLSAEGVAHAFADSFVGHWAPLTILSYQLDASLFGVRPWGFHLTNVLVHALSTGLLFVALLRMTAASGRSAAATLLFAIHPLRVESVAWIAERKDVLSVFFLVLALLAYEWYCRRPGLGRHAAVFAAMLGGLLCKATLVTLPVLLLLLDAWPLGRIAATNAGSGGPAGGSPWPPRTARELLLEKLPLAALSLLFAATTLVTQSRSIDGGASLPTVIARIPQAVCAVNWYAWKTLWPTGLSAFHRHPADSLSAAWLAANAAILLAATAAVILLASTRPYLAWGGGWYLVSLLPVIGLVQVGSQSLADRNAYIPHIGLMVAIVWGVADAARRFGLRAWLLPAALAAVSVALVAVDRRLIATWKDSESLWNRALALDPGSDLAHNKLGTAFYERGDLPRAIDSFRRGLAIRASERSHTFLGLALADCGRLPEAIGHYEAALAIDPDSAEAHNNLGIALARLGRLRESVPHFERACDLDPRDPLARANLSRAHAELRGGVPEPAGGDR